MNDITEFQIAKLQLNPGDILVVRFDGVLAPEQVARLREFLKRELPDTKTLIIDRSLELSVLTKAEIEARTTE